MTRQSFFASHLQGIYDPVKQYILYLGGEKRSNNPVNYTQNAIWRPFSEGLAFSTETNSWIPIAIKGDVPPSGRYGFTLTLRKINQHRKYAVLTYQQYLVLIDMCFSTAVTIMEMVVISY